MRRRIGCVRRAKAGHPRNQPRRSPTTFHRYRASPRRSPCRVRRRWRRATARKSSRASTQPMSGHGRGQLGGRRAYPVCPGSDGLRRCAPRRARVRRACLLVRAPRPRLHGTRSCAAATLPLDKRCRRTRRTCRPNKRGGARYPRGVFPHAKHDFGIWTSASSPRSQTYVGDARTRIDQRSRVDARLYDLAIVPSRLFT